MQVGQRSVGTLDRPRCWWRAFLLDQDVESTPPYHARAESRAASSRRWLYTARQYPA